MVQSRFSARLGQTPKGVARVQVPPSLPFQRSSHWARRLQALGHTVKLMAPQFVKPYVKTNKNDAADAEAICEAVARPNMRFVPIKNVEQQAVLALHRARQGFVKARTAQANQIRGLLAEFGPIIPKGIAHIAQRVPELMEDASNELPGSFRQLIARLTEHLKNLDELVDEFEDQIKAWHRSSELSLRLEKIPGIGPLGTSALVASIADANSFDNGRQLSAWLGLVPRQHSSGGKQTLLGISKRGDVYLRTLLIHGARSAIVAAQRKVVNTNVWLARLLNRRHPNVAAVALANKNCERFGRCWPTGASSIPATSRRSSRHSHTSNQHTGKENEPIAQAITQ
jgi:transposase